ncbi:MAG TPA: hypothetical protein VMZ26_04200 [Pyrinomonadaceae bacterium]|nr:hypothetical protein [Pyrinomonadaceae bacterium]
MKRDSFRKLFPLVSFLIGLFSLPPTIYSQTKVIWQKTDADPYTHVTFSHDGTIIALGREDSNTTDLLNASNGSVIRQLTTSHNAANVVRFTNDDRYLLSGVGHGGAVRTLALWDLASGIRAKLLGDHTNGTDSLSLSPDGQYAATSGDFDREINVWHVPDLTLLATFFNTDPVTGVTSRVKDVAFSTDGQRIASADINGVRVRNAFSGGIIFEIPNAEVTSIAYSPDGLYLAGAVPSEHAVKLWNAVDGTLIRTLNVTTTFDFPTIAFSPNGRSIVAGYNTGSDAGALLFWSVSNGRVLSFENTSGAVISVAFAPTGSTFAYTQFDGRIVKAMAPPI